MNKANALFESGAQEEGLQAALRAIEVMPLFPRTWLSKGGMENRMGRSALALASFREYLSLGESEPAKHKGAARRAVKELEAAGGKPAPPSAHAFLTQASLLIAEGKHAQAVVAADRALGLLPGLATALLLKGTAILELHDPRQALACFDRGLEADPGDPRLWHAKGAALALQDQHDRALVCFDEALRLHRGHLASRSGRAWSLLHTGRPADALAEFEQALSREAKDSLARFGKACAEDLLGRADLAARSYRKFLDRAEPALAPQIAHARERLRSLNR
jgi:tetratricopeptide (TPR) repeat protein